MENLAETFNIDEWHEWLSDDRMELHVLVNLASGFPPNANIGTCPIRLPRLRILKRAIKNTEVSALPGKLGNEPDM